jgi:hypothetical protein
MRHSNSQVRAVLLLFWCIDFHKSKLLSEAIGELLVRGSTHWTAASIIWCQQQHNKKTLIVRFAKHPPLLLHALPELFKRAREFWWWECAARVSPQVPRAPVLGAYYHISARAERRMCVRVYMEMPI